MHRGLPTTVRPEFRTAVVKGLSWEAITLDERDRRPNKISNPTTSQKIPETSPKLLGLIKGRLFSSFNSGFACETTFFFFSHTHLIHTIIPFSPSPTLKYIFQLKWFCTSETHWPSFWKRMYDKTWHPVISTQSFAFVNVNVSES